MATNLPTSPSPNFADIERLIEEAVSRQFSLRSHPPHVPAAPAAWWISGAGRFANDPVFDEIARLGRKAREAERPRRKTNKGKRAGSRH